ncbi:MAG: type II secretion system F family protein [Deltaproteobacteria bacterium]|uniref:type II secretion system F family protein n=1 Tax=Desulfobacula sp. TaxID=2593537 RepID=UPI0019BEFEA8|nr:type II secretion system F family protein [Candidatus Desulfobacula maris]MBL6993202.1 type II secretion system F family protein [Desulfobacula sp.]
MPITIQSKARPGIQKGKKKSFSFSSGSVKQKELFFFLTQLSLMVEVGISLSRAIETIRVQTTNDYFKKILEAMVKDIEEGHQLSAAMSRHPKVFKSVYVNMIRSGETGGFLPRVIDSIIEMLEKQQAIRSRLRGAMAYPMVLCGLAFVVTLFVLIGILPKFMVFFEGKYHILPPTTRIMMGLSVFLRSYWWGCILGAVGLVAGIRVYLSSKAFALHRDWLAIHVKLFSKLSNNIYTGFFLRTLGTMLENGIPLADAISIAGNTIENTYYKAYVENIRTIIEEGGHFSKGFALNKNIHESVKQMITVGEDVGKLPEVMLKLSKVYESETEESLNQIASLIEPIALVFMGIVVFIIVSSIILPMFRLAGAMK